MRIAAIIYGEARHIHETARSIREEFDIDGCKVDFFYHSWPYIGYKWADESTKRKYQDAESQIKTIKQSYEELYNPVAGYVSEEDSEVLDFCKKINETQDLLGGRGVYQLNNKARTFAIGQFFSLGKVMQQKIEYEKKHNFTYDAVFRVRTDMFYRGVEFYTDEHSYQKDKRERLDFILQNPDCVISDWGHVQVYTAGIQREDKSLPIRELSWKDGLPQIEFRGNEKPLFKSIKLERPFKDSDIFLVAGREAASSSETSNKCWTNIPDIYLLNLFSENVETYFGRRPPYHKAFWGEAVEGECILRNRVGFKLSQEKRHCKVIKTKSDIPAYSYFEATTTSIVVGSHDKMVKQAKKVWRKLK